MLAVVVVDVDVGCWLLMLVDFLLFVILLVACCWYCWTMLVFVVDGAGICCWTILVFVVVVVDGFLC